MKKINRILKRIAHTLLVKFDDVSDDEIKDKKYDEDVSFEELFYDPACGRIVTFDNGKIQDAEFQFRKWDEDWEEANGHGDLLDAICERNNLPEWQTAWHTPEFKNNPNIKLGFAITYKDCAFVNPNLCEHTNVNEVKKLILKFCPNIHYVYNYDPFDHNANFKYDLINPM